jgi:hypothetical protein
VDARVQVVQPYLAPLFNFSYGVAVLCGFFKDREVGGD